MAGELIRPGVEVLQTFAAPAPSFARPTLVPCVVGPAFEVVDVLNTDGSINAKAKFGSYAQLSLDITQSAFPDPRGNIDELDILEERVRPFLLSGGDLSELPMDLGEAFLTASHKSSRAALQTGIFSGVTGLALAGKVLILAIDVPARLDTTKDVTITFTGTSNLTSTQCADQINLAVGTAVATVVGIAPNDKVQIASLTYGARSSVTVRKGASANTTLTLDSGPNLEMRIEGSGYRAQDQNNNTTQSPWIEFYIGGYFEDGVSTSIVAAAGLINVETVTFVSALATAITFGTGNTIPIVLGDKVFADGLLVKNGEVAKIESTRYKIGTINTALSIADENGNYTTKVYDIQSFGTIFDPTPYAPVYKYFRATGIDWQAVAPVAAKITGTVAGTAATAGVITGTGAGAGPFSLAGLTLHYVSIVNNVTFDAVFTFTGGPFANMAAVEAAIGTNIPGVVASDDGGAPPQLRLTTASTGRLNSITIKIDGTANTLLGWSTVTDTTDAGTDVEFATLAGKSLKFFFDDNPHLYTVPFTHPSLDIAVDEINAVVGATVATKDTPGLRLVLTSPLKGLASKVSIPVQSPTQAEIVFGMSATPAIGTGRPLPDAYQDEALVLNIQPEILRDQVTGYPLDQTVTPATLYIQYKALRKDVSPLAQVVGVLRIPDTTTLGQVLDPLTEDNPLGLALFLTMINCPGFEVKAVGVDEVTAGSPEGSPLAYARAAALLEAEEVYAIAPLTQDEVVHGLWLTHVVAMSAPEQGGERIVFINKVMPTRKNPVVALSGTQANSTATINQLLLDANPAPGLVEAGRNPAQPFTVDMGVYVEFEVAGELRRYNLSSVSGSLANFNLVFTGSQNTDAFYSTTTFNVSLINAAYSLKVRGDSLTIPGSNPPRSDYSLLAETVAAANESLKNRRGFSIFPDTVTFPINGVTKSLAGYYAAAAIVGMVAGQPPQQGFTNFPITGITGVVGPEKFTKKQLNVMAGGGTYILMQDVPGGAIFCRHQLSTDLTSIETRELSITKVVDFVAKFLRGGVRKFIGTNNVTKELLDSIGTTIQGMLAFLIDTGVLNGANLNNIVQDISAPDTVLVDVTLDVPFPCNYIRLTLVV